MSHTFDCLLDAIAVVSPVFCVKNSTNKLVDPAIVIPVKTGIRASLAGMTVKITNEILQRPY